MNNFACVDELGGKRDDMDLETRLVHAPGDNDPRFGDVVVPIHLTTTYEQVACGQPIRYDYSRGGNPTRQVLEDQIAALEGGVAGFAFASGMAAITAVLSLFDPGDALLIPNNLYGGTYRVIERYFKRFGLTYEIIDFSDLVAVEAALVAQGTDKGKNGESKPKALIFETPTNPLLTIVDIAAISQIARRHGALTIVDNTFLTPYLQRPLALGADIVIHSATKYLGGHSDVLAGLITCTDAALAKRLHFIQYSTGAVLSPFDSYLLLRGIKTLAVRLERQSASAQALAEWLNNQSVITRVIYPGLSMHPGYAVHARQATSGGAIISFETVEDVEINELLRNLKIITLAESLGAVESLICHPATMTHASIPAPLRAEMGITDRLLRLSVGIESLTDLRTDLARALH